MKEEAARLLLLLMPPLLGLIMEEEELEVREKLINPRGGGQGRRGGWGLLGFEETEAERRRGGGAIKV